MLVGYNTNISFKGNVYHVQTEDNGIKNPVVITLLYLKGTILSSKKISYAHFAASPDYKEEVRKLMKEQHKSMIKELVSGKYTEGGTTETSDANVDLEPREQPSLKSQDNKQIAKSLDDILLDYIIKRTD